MGGTSNQAHGAAASMMADLTPVTLILILAFAAVVVIGMVYGARLRAKRRTAEDEEKRRIENAPPAAPAPQVGAEASPSSAPPSVPTSSPVPTQEPTVRTPPPPTAPPPPPLAGADEPVPAAAAYDASPASLTQPEPAAGPAGSSDADAEVMILKGLGPRVAARLGELGITRVGQIAALSPADAEDLDARLGAFKGRMGRDRWIDQAKLLAAGDRTGFEKEFGKL